MKKFDGKMSGEFVERFIRLENKKGLLRMVHPKQLLGASEPLAMLCKGDEEGNRLEEQCEKLAGVDALSKGVVTTWDTCDIQTPPSATREKITVKSWDTKSPNPSIDELAGG